MAYNKVVYGGNTLIDLTDLDVTAGDVVSGVNFIMADGTKAVGTITIPTKISDLTDDVGLVTQSTHLWHYTNPTATGYSFSANQYRSLSITLTTTYSGFTAIPVRAVCTSHSAIRVFNYSISNNATFNFETLSQSSSSLSGVNFAFTVLWLNNNYF